MDDYIIEFENIGKHFGSVVALNDVSFKVKRGSIHALVGENGAGKSTLMKIVSGFYPYGNYDGVLKINGETQKFNNVKDSENAGISIIYQELNLVNNLTICENIFLGDERCNVGIIKWNEQTKMAMSLLEKVHLDLPPSTILGNIGVGKQQLVEIAKAMRRQAQIFIFDEPTASLSASDTENLFVILNELKQQGTTCIYISHKLSEIFTIADTVTVLRDGNVITTEPIENFTEDQIIHHMVGRDLSEQYPRVEHTPGEVVMEVKNWTVMSPDNPNKEIVKDVNMTIKKGEILGISGVVGAGRTELAMSLFGAYGIKNSGELYIEGKKVDIKNPSQAIKTGLTYMSEDRKRYGLILSQDIATNIGLCNYKDLCKFGVINHDQETQLAMEYTDKLKIKTPSVYQLAGNLSGGNQQKVILGKWMPTKPKVLIIDEPTRGIDVGAKVEIYNIMNQLVSEGICIVMISSELPEILGMSDRIYVMKEGSVVAELDYKDATQEKIMSYSAASHTNSIDD